MRARRLINLRIVVLAIAAVGTFFAIFALTSGHEPPQYETLVVNPGVYLTPGERIGLEDVGASGKFQWLLIDGVAPASYYILPNHDLGTFINRNGNANDVLGQHPILVNTRYPGDVLTLADLYVPSAAACAASVNAPSASPVPGSSATPAPTASPGFTNPPVDTNTVPTIAQRVSDLLCPTWRGTPIDLSPISTYARIGDQIDIYLVIPPIEVQQSEVQRLLTKTVIGIVPNPDGSEAIFLNWQNDELLALYWAQAQYGAGALRFALLNPNDAGTGALRNFDQSVFNQKFPFVLPGPTPSGCVGGVVAGCPSASPTPEPTFNPTEPTPEPTPEPSPGGPSPTAGG
jgi:hypothetical protein